MTRARNRVIDGEYKGKPVTSSAGNVFIMTGLTKLRPLDCATVESITPISAADEISVASAATRGFIGELLFGPIGLAAAATATRKYVYTLAVLLKDGRRCVIEVDDKIYRLLTNS